MTDAIKAVLIVLAMYVPVVLALPSVMLSVTHHHDGLAAVLFLAGLALATGQAVQPALSHGEE